MLFKVDENLPHLLRDGLVARGHDAHTCHDERLAGAADPDVLAACRAEGRVLLTLDKGLGDLRRYPPGSHAGIVLLRLSAVDADTCLAAVERFLAQVPPGQVPGSLVVVDDTRIRVRRPPGP